MARKKKQVEILEGAGSNPANNLVQKSNPLLKLWKSNLTLQEFKILDIYISRINSEKSEQRIVRFRKGELEEILGITQLRKEDLEIRLSHLMSNVIKVEDPTEEKGFKLVTLFEEAAAWQDKNGLWTVDLQCTQSAMKYFFNIQKLGYLGYRLRCVMPLQSRYAYILFLYLESQRFRNPITIEVDELKKILSCDQETNYREFYRFRQKVLDRALNELHEKTEFRCTYETIKAGRKVTEIKFTLETLPEIILPADKSQITFDELGDDRDPWWVFSPLPWLTLAQGQEIKLLTLQVPEHKMPSQNVGSRENMYYDYLHFTQAKLDRAKEIAVAKNKPIKKEYEYLRAMIEKDAGIKDNE